MKKQNRYSTREIFKIKNSIKRVFPRASKINVKIDQLPNGEFLSFIRVLAPKKKELVVTKKDENASRSLEKSHMAIIKQVQRMKARWSYKNQKAVLIT
jgi:hypothetical protein